MDHLQLLAPDGMVTAAFHTLSGPDPQDAGFLGELRSVVGAWSERFTPPSVLYLSGAGALEQDLRRQVTRHGLEPNVRFAGHIDQGRLAALMCNARAFVLPSLTEGLGRTLRLGKALEGENCS